MADQYNHTLSNCSSLFFLLLLFIIIIIPCCSSLSPSSSQAHHQLIKPNIAPSNSNSQSRHSQYQEYYFKKSTVLFLNDKGFKKNKKGLMKNRRKKIKNLGISSSSSRPFSAMLPKGFVPPSGSSPCHNLHPNSVTFFCDLSTERP